ncbi:adenylate/guanylate cyclase domain-containing protein [Citricoccus sp. SGAir0253]|uniref:adenylate/guanylate cyclase domain-containing protein n=1 Tax=Citricoccus sp. SGAir0253 TaxID=2567881 RepID=UPI00352A13A2
MPAGDDGPGPAPRPSAEPAPAEVPPDTTATSSLGIPQDPATWTQAISDLEEELLGGPRTLTRREMAGELGVSLVSARKLWRALGFPNVQDGDRAFTPQDTAAIGTMIDLVRRGVLNEETAISLTRSIGQMTDRMVVWQIEALVENKISEEGMTDPQARREVVRMLPEIIEPLQQVMEYSYRRQLNSALQRLTVRVEAGLAASAVGRDGSEDDAPLPLARAVGFADMVSYTSLSRQMNERTLAQMVQRFENKCAEIISIGGGRLVKTVGDEVLFNAETPEAGAQISLALAKAMSDDPVLPSARVSLVWGRVLSRLGDIYGPTVNLASRLTALADPGTVLVDAMTAMALEDDERFILVPQPPRMVRGFGEIRPSILMPGSGEGLVVD